MSHDHDAKEPRSPAGTPALADRLPPVPPERPIIALGVIDEATDLKLRWSSTKRTLTLGSAKDADVVLKTLGVSRHHLTLQLQGNQVEVVDASSRNGTYFGPFDHEERQRARCVSAGDTFRIADTRVIALDDDLIGLRPHLRRVIGYDAHRAVHLALSTVAATRPLVILGKRGCDHAALAWSIHQGSKRRTGRFEAITSRQPAAEIVAGAWGGTVFLDLDVVKSPSASFIATVFHPSAHVRLIVASTTWKAVEAALGKERARLLVGSIIELVPLAARPADVPRIFDDLLVRELACERSITELGEANVEALKAYRWRDNLDSIRRVLDKLHARLESDSTAEAARRLGITRQSFSETLDGLGLVIENGPLPGSRQKLPPTKP
jgi:hypothetical protein